MTYKNNQNDQEKESNTVYEIDEEKLEAIRNQAKEKARSITHTWVQKGSSIVCETCEYPHGMYIGTDRIMVGIEGNVPKFVDRKEYMRKLREIKF